MENVLNYAIFGEVINCNRLNARESPSFNSPIVKTLDCGEKVEIIQVFNDTCTENIWYQLSTLEYVFGEYIALVEEDTANEM